MNDADDIQGSQAICGKVDFITTLGTALKMAGNIAQKSALALQLIKIALNMGHNGMNYEDNVRLEDRNQAIRNLAMASGINTTGCLGGDINKK